MDLYREGKNIYYNIGVVNKNEDPKEFRYFDKRATNLVSSGYKYKLAVVRFSVDPSKIPIMYFPSTQFSSFSLNQNYSTADNNYYSVTIDDGDGTVKQAYLQFESFTNNSSDLRIFTIDHFIQILNKTIVTACDGTTVNVNRIPYFIYDRDRAIIDIVFHEDFANLMAKHKFYMNKKLWAMFDNFTHSITDLNQERYVKIDVFLNGTNKTTNTVVHTRNSVINNTEDLESIIVRGEYCTIYKFYQVRNLIFTTNSLPIRSEFLNNTFDFASETSYGSQKILKNFEFDLESTNALHCRSIQNFSANEYEFIDLEDSREITDIDLQIYYSDIHGRVFPLEVPSDSLTTVKLLFHEF